MSEHSSHAHHKGEMDIHEQASTYAAVNGLIKWGSLALAVFLILTVVWTCTPMGAGPAFILSVIVGGLGIFALRGKSGGH